MNLVSVLLPIYNNFFLAKKAIKSVINQTYQNWELIIIDDKSNDGTRAKLNKYKNNPKIKIIKNEKNSGCYVSLNNGLKEAKGVYIARVDSDDSIHPDKLIKQVKILDDDPNINMVFCRCKGNISGVITYKSLGSAMFRKEIIDTIGYFDSVRIAADQEFKERYFIKYGKTKFIKMSEILYNIIERNNSLSRNPLTGLGSLHRTIYKKNYKIWHKNNENLYIEYPLKKIFSCSISNIAIICYIIFII